MKLLLYNFTTEQYSQPSQVKVDEFCNGITVKNIGAAPAATVLFNGIPLLINESFSLGGNEREIFRGRIDIDFTGLGSTLAVVIQKYYLPTCLTDFEK